MGRRSYLFDPVYIFPHLGVAADRFLRYLNTLNVHATQAAEQSKRESKPYVARHATVAHPRRFIFTATQQSIVLFRAWMRGRLQPRRKSPEISGL